ncbi:MAG: sulfur carrier protein ThiS [Bacteroidaceae bacterium]|nr:sulfur carrier protein ThiS [Bacteroidaceae bacterium]
MNITLNNTTRDIAPDTTVRQLLIEVGLPQLNVAVAVNNQIVPRQLWDSTILVENDNVVVIAAAYGG